MKKAVLFLGLLGGLVSCNSAPECGDKEVSKLVREIIIDNYDIVDWWAVVHEYYAEDHEKYEKEMKELYQNFRNKYGMSDDESFYDYFSSKRQKIEGEYYDKRQEIENKVADSYNYGDVENYISEKNKKLEELRKEEESMLAKINNEQESVDRAKGEIEGRYKWGEKWNFVQKAYKQEDKIQEIINRLYSVEISNIRNVSFDKENKKCDCEATLKWGDNKSKEIYFTAQRNTDGDLYVEVMQ